MAGDGKMRAGVVGATGYIGSELMRILSVHPGFEIAWVSSQTRNGSRVADLFPNLAGYVDDEFVSFEPARLDGLDFALFCLPHGEGIETIKAATESHPKLKIVDCSGDFRSPVIDKWELYYKTRHTAPELQSRFVYGCPEFNREKIAGAQYVAAPGCFATSINLCLAPFAAHGDLVGEIAVTAITGSSGSGGRPGATTHHPERNQNVRAYKVLEHQHMVEVVPFLQGLHSGGEGESNDFDIHFVPQSGPFVRGIFTTAFIPLNATHSLATVDAMVREAYRDEPFVSIVEGTPEMRLVAGTNRAQLAFRAQGEMMVAMCAIDNLVKGGAGQAVQCMNLMAGLDETTGLMHPAGFV